ncbi:PAS domain S-box protein [Aliigemmobacter aestuarii]|uniref:histidine kinase n=1 Tax=Aliigemmobacter aestuarii TaxID=1445661 RepID=A0A4S3MKZ2_9RHOB|nr:PAS domain-containing protein [Gemmobacter aestuarii]THD82443.1 PAS domain S-box protein [Gemmobacter aestuarii]
MSARILQVIDDIIGVQGRDVTPAILHALAAAGEIAGVDRSYVYRLEGADRMRNTHEWVATGITPVIEESQDLPANLLDIWREALDAGQPFEIADVRDLPDGSPERVILEGQGVQSLLIAPFLHGGRLAGFVGYDAVRRCRPFLPFEIRLLQSLAKAIGVVLDRAKAEAAAEAAKAALLAKRDRLKAMLAALPDMVVELDRDGRLVAFNEGADTSSFLTPSQFIGCRVDEALPPTLGQQFIQALARFDRDGRCDPFDYEITVNGKNRWHNATIARRSLDGREDGYFLIIRDFTERHHQQRRIARLGKIAELTSNMVIVTDAEARIEWVNPAFEQRSGWTLDEVRGHRPQDVFRSDRPHMEAQLKVSTAIAEGTPVQIEMLNRSRQGQEYWISMDIQPMHDESGRLDGFVAVHTDITDLKKTHHKELRDLRLAIEASRDGIALIGPGGAHGYMNSAYRDLFGIDGAEHALTIHWADLFPPDVPCAPREQDWHRLVARGNWRGSLKGVARDGRILPLELSATIRDDGSLLVIVRDMAERLRAEKEQALLLEKLHIAQRRETIAHVASEIAHDLNNVVAVVSNAATLLEAQCRERPDVLASVRRIKRAAHVAGDLVGGLGHLGRSNARPARQDLRALVAQGIDLLGSSRIEQHGIALSLPDTEQPVWADSTRLLQVVVNLALNACEADPERPARVRAAVLPGTEWQPARPPDLGTWSPGADHAVFRISDTGAGISPRARERLFEPYFTTKGKAGTGLGLPIVGTILRESGAALWLDSAPGQGTVATVAWPSVPIAPALPRPPAGGAPAKPPGRATADAGGVAPLAGMHILVVDDDADLADQLSEMLDARGAVALAITDPHEASALLNETPGLWSALLTDMHMPGMDGIGLSALAASLDPPVPAVVITTHPDRVPLPSPGIREVLGKPAAEADLIRALLRVSKRPAAQPEPSGQD